MVRHDIPPDFLEAARRLYRRLQRLLRNPDDRLARAQMYRRRSGRRRKW